MVDGPWPVIGMEMIIPEDPEHLVEGPLQLGLQRALLLQTMDYRLSTMDHP